MDFWSTFVIVIFFAIVAICLSLLYWEVRRLRMMLHSPTRSLCDTSITQRLRCIEDRLEEIDRGIEPI